MNQWIVFLSASGSLQQNVSGLEIVPYDKMLIPKNPL